MAWQPRIIKTPPELARPSPGAVRRLAVRRVGRAGWQQRGFVLRTAVRLGLCLLAWKALPPSWALLVVGIMVLAQALCDEPAPPPDRPHPSLKSI